ncbi:FeoB-associated Cys-rich membrane protein [Clostridium cavendishii]|nr:FeoB-associated Cys-rich membrane protein [Clostridium cavendishii]
MEIFITILIVLLAIFIILKNIKNSSKGQCNCGSCSSHCPKYKNKK